MNYDRTTITDKYLCIYIDIYILAWEPRAAKVTKSYTPAIYPHLNDFTRKLNFRY